MRFFSSQRGSTDGGFILQKKVYGLEFLTWVNDRATILLIIYTEAMKGMVAS